MILAWLLLLTGLTISAVAIYYSVVGLTAIFAAAAIPIIVMGTALEVAKLVCATWLKANWERAPILLKTYMTTAVAVLMIITSMGIFGFLSKAHSDQSLVSGDVQSKIAVYDEKIRTARDNIDANRKALKQMDEAVDQVMGRSSDEKGADKAVSIRRSQQKERARLQSEIASEQKVIAAVSEERAPIAAEVRKVEAEVGPLKYIAAFVYGETNETILEKAVTWVIIMIVVVFDPLAVIMLLAAQMTFAWQKKEPVADIAETPAQEEPQPITEEDFNDPELTAYLERSRAVAQALDRGDPLPLAADQVTWPFPSYERDDGPLTNEQVSQIEQTVETDLDLWNKMIAEAEAEAAKTDEDTITDRLARGESFVNSEGTEESIAEQEQLEQEFLERFQENLDNGQTILAAGIDERPGDYLPEHNPLSTPNLDLKKKTYMTKDQEGKAQVKTRD